MLCQSDNSGNLFLFFFINICSGHLMSEILEMYLLGISTRKSCILNIESGVKYSDCKKHLISCLRPILWKH